MDECCNPFYAYQTGFLTKAGKPEYFIDFQRISHGFFPLSKNNNIKVNYQRKDIVKLVDGHPCLVKYVKIPCRKCPACQVRKASEWSTRLYFEATQHPFYYFTTLTYSDGFLPSDEDVAKRDLQLFLKRLRKNFGDQKLRYFAQFEYGDHTHRPHFHIVFFLDDLPDDQLTYLKTSNRHDYFTSDLVQRSWQKGFDETAFCKEPNGVFNYVSRYCCKKSGSDIGFHRQSMHLGSVASQNIIDGSYLLIHNNGRTYHASIPEYIKKILEVENHELYTQIRERSRVWVNLQYEKDKSPVDNLDGVDYYKFQVEQFLSRNSLKFRRNLK